MRKNICLVTWYNSINYGTCIQCYALSKFLSMQGYNVYIPDTYRYYYGLKHLIETLNVIKTKVIFKLKNPNKINKDDNMPLDIREGYKKRRQKNTEFAYKYNQIININSNKKFMDIINSTDFFVTGSDQIWNPRYCAPPFLLSFAQKGKKLSYASSIGVSVIPADRKKMYKKYLKSFDSISVREKTARNALNAIFDKDEKRPDINIVLDPSFLLDKLQWNEIADNSGLPEGKYLFCYFIGDCNKWEKYIKAFADKYSLKIYYALSESNVLPHIGEIRADIGVRDFIAFIENAEYVITDSFHAVVLSIIFNKNFVVYRRFSDNSILSQNSRIFDILSEFKLMDRLVENDITDKISYDIDYSEVNLILDKRKKDSINYLIDGLKG